MNCKREQIPIRHGRYVPDPMLLLADREVILEAHPPRRRWTVAEAMAATGLPTVRCTLAMRSLRRDGLIPGAKVGRRMHRRDDVRRAILAHHPTDRPWTVEEASRQLGYSRHDCRLAMSYLRSKGKIPHQVRGPNPMREDDGLTPQARERRAIEARSAAIREEKRARGETSRSARIKTVHRVHANRLEVRGDG